MPEGADAAVAGVSLEISNAGMSRSAVRLTACSKRSPLAMPGLVKSAARNGVKVIVGGWATAKFFTA